MARKPASGPSGRRLTPLWIISLFVGLTEAGLGIAATKLSGTPQASLLAFVIAFPLAVAIAFFGILWYRPWVFYSPAEYGNIDPAQFISSLAQASAGKVVTKTADLPGEVTVVGNPDHLRLLFKAAGAGWKKSTKAMDVGVGCVVQVSSERLGPNGSFDVAEALTFIPNVTIVDDPQGQGRHLVRAAGAP